MGRIRWWWMFAATLAVFFAPACDSGVAPEGTPTEESRPASASEISPSASPEPPEVLSARQYSSSLFSDVSTTIDNQWFPLAPGTQFVYSGRSGIGKESERHRVVFTVTDLGKVIDGVRTLVTWDRDYTAGALVETEIALFAQDDGGNVWHFGQYPEEYVEGKFAKAPAWIAGVKGARTGITMKAEPKLGAPDYAQGFAPKPINWIDRARAREVGTQTCVPAGCYEDVLITEEFERDKPGAFQLKFYAPEVGNVRIGWAGPNDQDHEELVLVAVKMLSPEELEEVRTKVLALEAHAYEISPDVYGTTPPSEPLAV